MISEQLLKILCCPESHSPLLLAPEELLENLKTKASAGELINKAGEQVKPLFESGLVTEDKKTFYRIENQIPILLIEEGIALP